MDKYLKLLLETENTVIIPDLGAIMVTDDGSKRLMFNEYLKFNDGKLDKFIAANSNMDEQEAKNFVAKYVREIKAALDQGDTYNMYNFGSFVKTNDKIEFTSDDTAKPSKISESVEVLTQKVEEKFDEIAETENLKIEEEKTSISSAKEKIENKVDKVKEELKTKANDLQNSATENIEKAKDVVSEKIEGVKATASKAIPIVSEIKAENSSEKKNVYIPPTEVKATEKENTNTVSATLNEKKEIKEVEKKKKRGVVFWLLLFLCIVICGGAIYSALNLNQVKGWIGLKTAEETVLAENTIANKEELNNNDEAQVLEEEATENIIDNETNLNENIADSALIENEAQESEFEENTDAITNTDVEVAEIEESTSNKATFNSNDGATSNGKFKVMGGSFGVAENALNLVTKLKAKGYDARVSKSASSKYHKVIVQAYSTREAAQMDLSRIREDVEGAYIAKF